MIIQGLFSRKTLHDKYHPVLNDSNYDVNVKEDNPDFDKHLKKKVKGDKQDDYIKTKRIWIQGENPRII